MLTKTEKTVIKELFIVPFGVIIVSLLTITFVYLATHNIHPWLICGSGLIIVTLLCTILVLFTKRAVHFFLCRSFFILTPFYIIFFLPASQLILAVEDKRTHWIVAFNVLLSIVIGMVSVRSKLKSRDSILKLNIQYGVYDPDKNWWDITKTTKWHNPNVEKAQKKFADRLDALSHFAPFLGLLIARNFSESGEFLIMGSLFYAFSLMILPSIIQELILVKSIREVEINRSVPIKICSER